MKQAQEDAKKPHFGPDLGRLVQTLGCQFFFIKLVLRHYSKL